MIENDRGNSGVLERNRLAAVDAYVANVFQDKPRPGHVPDPAGGFVG